MKEFKVLSLAVVFSFMALPALAGDAFVNNNWIIKTERTENEQEVDSVTRSNRTEHYHSHTEKIFFDGNLETTAEVNNSALRQNGSHQVISTYKNSQFNSNLYSDSDPSSILLNDEYSEFSNVYTDEGRTIHKSGSSLSGNFSEDVTTKVWGTIYDVTTTTVTTHETSAGVR